MHLRNLFAVFFLLAAIPLLILAADEKDKKDKKDKKSADISADSAGSSAGKKDEKDKKDKEKDKYKKGAFISAGKKSAGISAEAFIKNHAAKEFAFSKAQVSVKDVGVINGKQEYQVSAAGETVRYRFDKGKFNSTTVGETICTCCYVRIDGTCGCLECRTK